MQLASYLGWEVVLKCRPGGSRTLDVVRSVGFLNEGFGVFRVFLGFFFLFTWSSKWEQHPTPREEKRKGTQQALRHRSVSSWMPRCVLL